MSRNKEKAQSALNRYQQEVNKQAGVLESNPNVRPKYVQSVKSLPQAEKWRSVVISLISTSLTRIQDLMLDDETIRELNNSINTLLKEKRAWEHHIKSLGGPDYLRFGPSLESTGVLDEVNGDKKGFRYFGRAKELPEMKMLLKAKADRQSREQNAKEEQVQQTRDLQTRFANLDPSYYLYFGSTNEPDVANDIFKALGKETELGPVELDSEDEEMDAVSKQLHEDIRQESAGNSPGVYSEGAKNIKNYAAVVPDQETIREYVINKKKEQVLQRLS